VDLGKVFKAVKPLIKIFWFRKSGAANSRAFRETPGSYPEEDKTLVPSEEYTF
ncbi:hypothetical protein HN51_067603, partial [Arachis hypogaea]